MFLTEHFHGAMVPSGRSAFEESQNTCDILRSKKHFNTPSGNGRLKIRVETFSEGSLHLQTIWRLPTRHTPLIRIIVTAVYESHSWIYPDWVMSPPYIHEKAQKQTIAKINFMQLIIEIPTALKTKWKGERLLQVKVCTCRRWQKINTISYTLRVSGRLTINAISRRKSSLRPLRVEQ